MPFKVPPYPPGLPVPPLQEPYKPVGYARKINIGEPWMWFVITMFTCGAAAPMWVISIISKHRKPKNAIVKYLPIPPSN